MWNLKNNINKQNRNRIIDTDNRLMVTQGRGLGDWVKKAKGLRDTDASYKMVTGT